MVNEGFEVQGGTVTNPNSPPVLKYGRIPTFCVARSRWPWLHMRKCVAEDNGKGTCPLVAQRGRNNNRSGPIGGTHKWKEPSEGHGPLVAECLALVATRAAPVRRMEGHSPSISTKENLSDQ